MPNFYYETFIIKDIFEKKRNKKVKIRVNKKFCKETFLNERSSQLASQLDEISVALLKHNSVDEMFNEFVEIVDENAPYKTLSKKRKLKEKQPWITKTSQLK